MGARAVCRVITGNAFEFFHPEPSFHHLVSRDQKVVTECILLSSMESEMEISVYLFSSRKEGA